MQLLKKKDPHEVYMKVGFFILVISLAGLLIFFGSNNLVATGFIGLTWLGILPILDYFLWKEAHIYFLPDSKKDLKRFLVLCGLSIMFCIILEFSMLYTTRLWVYPYIHFSLYFFLAPFYYIFYTLILFELYEIFKHLFKHHKKPLKISQKSYKLIMYCEMLAGTILMATWIIYSISNVLKFDIPFWKIHLDPHISVPIWFGFATLLSVFFIFEFVAYTKKRNTFTEDLLKGDIRPAISIMSANIIAIALIEMLNAPFQLWVFVNWFRQDLKFLTMPVGAIILWPIQFLAFLAIFNAFIEKRKTEIW